MCNCVSAPCLQYITVVAEDEMLDLWLKHMRFRRVDEALAAVPSSEDSKARSIVDRGEAMNTAANTEVLVRALEASACAEVSMVHAILALHLMRDVGALC